MLSTILLSVEFLSGAENLVRNYSECKLTILKILSIANT